LVNEIAILDQLANEGIHVPQAELGSALQITTDELIFVDSHLQGYGTSLLGSRRAELFRQGDKNSEIQSLVMILMVCGNTLEHGAC